MKRKYPIKKSKKIILEQEKKILKLTNKIIFKEKYKKIPLLKDKKLFELLENNFSFQKNIIDFLKKQEKHLITGFGPTNPPTAGTLSVLFRFIRLHNILKCGATIIISDVGAFNSRNIELKKIDFFTKKFLKFIKKLDFKGELRTHKDLDLLLYSGIISKYLEVQDFYKNKEFTKDVYKKLGIYGGDFPSMFDFNLCISDILLPIFKFKKSGVLVVTGADEYFLPKTANLIIKRIRLDRKNNIFLNNPSVSSLLTGIIRGLNGYPKMSKSIFKSSINLGNSKEELYKKIVNCSSEEDDVILQMIEMVSNWKIQKIKKARILKSKNNEEWKNMKNEYFLFFLDLKKKWDNS